LLIFVRFSNEVFTKRKYLWCKWRKRRHGYTKNTFNTIPFYFHRNIRYSIGCHGDGGTVSRNNVRTTIFQLLRNRRKWRKIPTNNFISFAIIATVYLHYLVCWCRPLAAPAAFRLEITLPTILISTNYTFTLSSNLQLQITNTINHYIANYKSRIENTTQAIAKVTAMRSNSMKTNKTSSKENIKLHEFVAMKSLIYIFSNIWFNNKQIFLQGFICSFHLIWCGLIVLFQLQTFENNLTWKSTPFSIFERSCHKTEIVVASEENTDMEKYIQSYSISIEIFAIPSGAMEMEVL